LVVTTRTVSVTTASTTAAHTALRGSVTPVDIPHYIRLLATTKAGDYTVAIVTMMLQTADISTGSARAIDIIHLLKRQALAQILADIMTSDSDDAFTIRAAVHIIRRTASATSTDRRIFPDQTARL